MYDIDLHQKEDTIGTHSDHTLRNALFGMAGGIVGVLASRLYWRVTKRVEPEVYEHQEKAGEKENVLTTTPNEPAGPILDVYETFSGRRADAQTRRRLDLWGDLILGGTKGAVVGMIAGHKSGFGITRGLAVATSMWLLRSDAWKQKVGLIEHDPDYSFTTDVHRLGARLSHSMTQRVVTQGLHELTARR